MALAPQPRQLIIAEEVSSEATYRKKYVKPEWPKGQSGITVGIGYDLGYSTKQQIASDWGSYLPASTVAAMQKYAGLTGKAAEARLSAARAEISVPWEAAIAEFDEVETPKWEAKVRAVLPNYDQLHPICKGVLVSLTYNRGPSYNNTGDRFTEMRAIKAHMKAKDFSAIPAEFRSMARLWKGTAVAGVATRRNTEATLFEKGLLQMGLPVVAKPQGLYDPQTEDSRPPEELPAESKPLYKSNTARWSVAGIVATVSGYVGMFTDWLTADWRNIAIIASMVMVLIIFFTIIAIRYFKEDIRGLIRQKPDEVE